LLWEHDDPKQGVRLLQNTTVTCRGSLREAPQVSFRRSHPDTRTWVVLARGRGCVARATNTRTRKTAVVGGEPPCSTRGASLRRSPMTIADPVARPTVHVPAPRAPTRCTKRSLTRGVPSFPGRLLLEDSRFPLGFAAALPRSASRASLESPIPAGGLPVNVGQSLPVTVPIRHSKPPGCRHRSLGREVNRERLRSLSGLPGAGHDLRVPRQHRFSFAFPLGDVPQFQVVTHADEV
jgi:hypothetical protein